MNQTNETLSWLICVLLPTLLSIFVMLIMLPSAASAGIIGDIADLGLKVALIRHWKAFLGVILLLGGAYAIAHKPPFKHRPVAIAASCTLYAITFWGVVLLLGEFWNKIEPIVESVALFIKRLF